MSIYFDNAAATPISKAALAKMTETAANVFGNPSSGHLPGMAAGQAVETARKTIAELMNIQPGELFFTSGGTESNNLAIFGAAKRPGSRIITSKAEHPSVLEPFKALEQAGFDVVYLPLSNGGEVSLEALEASVSEKTALVSLMHVNHETGVISDLETIGKIIKRQNKETLFHVDAVQSFGKHDLQMKKWNIDLLSVSAHKANGPKGAGAIYVREETRRRLKPLIYGGGQQKGVRPGTENTPAIAAFGVSAAEAFLRMNDELEKIRAIKERLFNIPKEIDCARLNGAASRQSPYIANFSFVGIPSEVMLNALNAEGIYVSAGSACNAGKKSPDNVPSAYGLGKERAGSAVRVSLGVQNTLEEAEIFIKVLKRIVTKVKGA